MDAISKDKILFTLYFFIFFNSFNRKVTIYHLFLFYLFKYLIIIYFSVILIGRKYLS